MWTMCGLVCILLYYVLYQSSLWLPDFNKLLVLSCLHVLFHPVHSPWLTSLAQTWQVGVVLCRCHRADVTTPRHGHECNACFMMFAVSLHDFLFNSLSCGAHAIVAPKIYYLPVWKCMSNAIFINYISRTRRNIPEQDQTDRHYNTGPAQEANHSNQGQSVRFEYRAMQSTVHQKDIRTICAAKFTRHTIPHRFVNNTDWDFLRVGGFPVMGNLAF